jgi:hypothetical protein
MEWLRGKIGLTTTTDTQQQQAGPPSTLKDADENRARLMRTFKLRIDALREEDAELEEQVADAAARGDRAGVVRHMGRRKTVASEIAEYEGKLANQRETANTIGRADANKEQALLLQDGAKRLGALVAEAERIDIDTVVDDYRDGAAATHDYSRRLAEPLDAGSAAVDPDELDAEVEALMQRAADERRLAMPAVPVAHAQPLTPTAVRQRRAAPLDVNK